MPHNGLILGLGYGIFGEIEWWDCDLVLGTFPVISFWFTIWGTHKEFSPWNGYHVYENAVTEVLAVVFCLFVYAAGYFSRGIDLNGGKFEGGKGRWW